MAILSYSLGKRQRPTLELTSSHGSRRILIKLLFGKDSLLISSHVQKENKMGTMPVPKLLFQMSIPMMLSMLVQALYNVIDSIFVAQINENALTAVSLAFPLQNLMISIAVGTGVGVNALLSRSLGEKNMKAVQDTARNGLFLSVASFIVFALFSLIIIKPLLSFQTNDSQILEYGTTYLRIVTLLSAGVFMGIMLERLLQATGRTF